MFVLFESDFFAILEDFVRFLFLDGGREIQLLKIYYGSLLIKMSLLVASIIMEKLFSPGNFLQVIFLIVLHTVSSVFN